MMSSVMNSTNPHPARIAGYDGGLFTYQVGLLDEPLFWLGHLYSCAQSEEAEELLFGADYDVAGDFQRQLWERGVVYRTVPDDAGTDYLLHHPDWDQAEVLARDDGHFMGPGLSWPELVAAADNLRPGGSTTDPHSRLLLLLPAFGDDAVPDDAVDRLADALRARTSVEDPETLAAALLKDQGAPGPARWTIGGGGFSVNDGKYSFRNPTNPFALPADRLAQVASALAP